MLQTDQHIVAVDFGGDHFLSLGVAESGCFADIVQAAVLTGTAPGFNAAFVAGLGPRVYRQDFAVGRAVAVYRCLSDRVFG